MRCVRLVVGHFVFSDAAGGGGSFMSCTLCDGKFRCGREAEEDAPLLHLYALLQPTDNFEGKNGQSESLPTMQDEASSWALASNLHLNMEICALSHSYSKTSKIVPLQGLVPRLWSGMQLFPGTSATIMAPKIQEREGIAASWVEENKGRELQT